MLEAACAIVTGGASGIGRAVVERFVRDGARVAILDRDREKGEAAAASIRDSGGEVFFLEVDIGVQPEIERSVGIASERLGGLDVCVCNAGITDRVPFLSLSPESFERVLRTNLYGTLFTGQAAARIMVPRRSGRIVNTTSVSGQFGGTGRAAYGASKAAIINLTSTMSMELARYNILVNAVAPGPTQIERTAHGPEQKAAFLSRLNLKRYADPAEVAAAVAFLASSENTYVTGHVLNVDGGFATAGVAYDPDASPEPPADAPTTRP